MHIDPESPHGWQALRYAARHLSDAEQREFEDRLCEDQAARDAVAQAVELAHTATFLHLDSESELSDLTAALRAAPARSTLEAAFQATAPAAVVDAPQRQFPSSWTHKAGWWSAAAAACVALVALWSANKNLPAPAASHQAGTEQVTTDITNAWADLNTQRLTSLDPAEDVATESLPSVRELPRDSDDALVLDWLLNGLRQEALTPGERGSEIPRTN
jgi:anti-sigma-K factor RskA